MSDISPSRLFDQKVLFQKFSSDALMAVIPPITKHLYETGDRLLTEFKENLGPNLSDEEKQARVTEFESKLIPIIHQHIRSHSAALAGGFAFDNFPDLYAAQQKELEAQRKVAGDNNAGPAKVVSEKVEEPRQSVVIGLQGIESETKVMGMP